MFITEADNTTLRQGDIIADITFPLPRTEGVTFLGTHKRGKGEYLEPAVHTIGKAKTQWLTGQIDVAISFCAVLGQCCEVDRSQNRPPPSFVLCRLVDVPDGIRKRPELYGTLTENVNPYGSGRPFYQLFFISLHPSLSKEYVADYGQAMSVRWGDYDTVLRRKILQMDDVNRAKFRVKAGAFFGRPTLEEIDAGIADPWRQETRGEPVVESLGQRLRRAFRIALGRE